MWRKKEIVVALPVNMKNGCIAFFFIVALSVCAAAQFEGHADFILTLKNACRTDKTFIDLQDQYHLKPKFTRLLHGCMPVRCPPEISRSTVRRLLESDSRIAWVEPDYRISVAGMPDDPYFPRQWSLYNRVNTGVDIRAVEAWGLHRGTKRIILAVIDTGIDYLHPDLAANLWRNPGEIPGNNRDDDDNGFIDDLYGWSFAEGNADPIDRFYHGTHVAGIIGAVANNGRGIAGIMHSVSIMAVKGLGDSGFGWSSSLIAGIYYAVDNGARIINASWGGGGRMEAMIDALAYAESRGVIFVAAAGNYRRDNDVSPFYPASYEGSNVVSVAATDTKDSLAWFSHWGRESVDLFAPGVDIFSTVLRGDYAPETGTSMAAPHVAGALGLLASFAPSLDWREYVDALYTTVRPLPWLQGTCATGGKLDLYRCLREGVPRVRALQAAVMYLSGILDKK
ncbi:MAG: S8 family serine peptidase [Chitinispirillaceae bacterium]|nr:S8 family serine peptidase [Chitinispirillaceae bacterium]